MTASAQCLVKFILFFVLVFEWQAGEAASLDPIVFEPCDSGLDFVAIDWNDVAGATCYNLTISNLSTGTVTTEVIVDSEFFVAGLNENDEIEFQVTAKSNDPNCQSTATTFCSATACAQYPPLSFNSCSEAIGAITFSWNAIPGITDFIVTNAEDNIPINQSELDFVVTGLTPLQTVNITVQPVHPTPGCAISLSTISCTAPCPSIPMISNLICADAGIDFVLYEWDEVMGTNGYEITWSINGAMTTSDTILVSELSFPGELSADDLNPEDEVSISVVAINMDPFCGNSEPQFITCVASGCPIPIFTDLNPEVCWQSGDGPIQLSIGDVTDANGNLLVGDIEWLNSNGSFIPSDTEISGSYSYSFEWSDRNFPAECKYRGEIVVKINIRPTPFINPIVDRACVGGAAMIMGTDSPDPQVELTFDFDGGDVIEDNWPEQIELIYNAPGIKTVTLSETSAPNCEANTSINIEIVEVLLLPVYCVEVSSSSITFGWDALPGALGYNYSIDGGPPNLIPNTEVRIDGLSLDEVVTIEVTGFFDPNYPCDIIGATSCTTGNTDVTELKNQEVSIYPNPAANILHLEYSQQNLDATLNTIDGRTLPHKVEKNMVDVSDLNSGLYLLIFTNHQTGKKFAKQFIIL